MEKVFLVIKRVILTILMLYALNLMISSLNIMIPINIINVAFVSIFGIPGILVLAILVLVL